MIIKFHLTRKEDEASNLVKDKLNKLKNEIVKITSNLKELGYDSSTVNEVRYILSRHHGHDAFLKSTETFESQILGRINADLKPTYQQSSDYLNLEQMKTWVGKQSLKCITRTIDGELDKIVTVDEFIAEMQGTPWTKFGMPKRYNKKEDTIWDNLRH